MHLPAARLRRPRAKGETKARAAVVALAAFVCIFFSFEVLHPAADLLHAQAHCAAVGEAPPLHATHGAEDPVGDAHGPFALRDLALLQPPVALVACAPPRQSAPEQPALEPRSPIPIPG